MSESTAIQLTFTADVTCEGQRLDRAISALLPQFSRAFLQNAIHSGEILCNGKTATCAMPLRSGDCIQCHIHPPELTSAEPEEIPLDILQEDSYLLLLNKPAGLVVHPAEGTPRGTVVNGLLFRNPEIFRPLQKMDGLRPGIVHRLDRDTSGVLLVVKEEETYWKCKEMFQNHTIRKTYLAIVLGVMPKLSGTIDCPIGRHPSNPLKRTVAKDGKGKPAITEYETVGIAPDQSCSLLRIQLKTGRTHQIRVHCAHLRHPILGDALYGGCPSRMPFPAKRQMLHAWKIRFNHPVSGVPVHVTAPVPEDFSTAAYALHLAVKP